MDEQQPNAEMIESMRKGYVSLTASLRIYSEGIQKLCDWMPTVPPADVLRMGGSYGGPSLSQAIAATIHELQTSERKLRELERAIRNRKATIATSVMRRN